MLGRIFLVFTCGVLWAESMVYKKRQPEGCEEFVACSRPLENFFVEEEDLPTFLGVSDEQTLDNFCQLQSQQEQCFEDARDGCEHPDVVAQVEPTIAVAAYICSDKGRQVILAMADSECAADETRQLEVNEAIQSCLEKFEFDVMMLTVAALSKHTDLDPAELCPFAKSWTECTVAAAESKCGDAFSDFLSDILDITAEPKFEQLGCEDTVNNRRQIIGRSIDWIKRAIYRRTVLL